MPTDDRLEIERRLTRFETTAEHTHHMVAEANKKLDDLPKFMAEHFVSRTELTLIIQPLADDIEELRQRLDKQQEAVAQEAKTKTQAWPTWIGVLIAGASALYSFFKGGNQ